MAVNKGEYYVLPGSAVEGQPHSGSFHPYSFKIPTSVTEDPNPKEAMREWFKTQGKFAGYEGQLAVVRVVFAFDRTKTETATITGEEDAQPG